MKKWICWHRDTTYGKVYKVLQDFGSARTNLSKYGMTMKDDSEAEENDHWCMITEGMKYLLLNYHFDEKLIKMIKLQIIFEHP